MQIDTLSQINEVINSLVKKGNLKQANNLNQLYSFSNDLSKKFNSYPIGSSRQQINNSG